jgi:hypothetical protein
VQKYLRPDAVKAGRRGRAKGAPWVPQLPSFTGFAPGEDESRPEDRADFLRQAHIATTLAVRPLRQGVEAGRAGQVPGAVARRHSTPCSQSEFSDYLAGTLGGRFRPCAAKCFGMMVARDGIEPPPAVSGLAAAPISNLLIAYNLALFCQPKYPFELSS